MKFSKKFKSLRLLLAGSSLCAVIGYSGYLSLAKNVRDVEQKAKTFGQTVLERIDQSVSARNQETQAFALSQSARSLDSASLADFMDDMVATYAPLYDLMLVADASGKIVATNTRDKNGFALDLKATIGSDVATANWFQQALSGNYKVFVEDVHIDRLVKALIPENSGRVLSFSAPIVDKNTGKVLGVWSSRMSWFDGIDKIIAAELQRVEFGKKIFHLIDASGAILYSSSNKASELNGSFINDEAIFDGYTVGNIASAPASSLLKWRSVVEVQKFDDDFKRSTCVSAAAVALILSCCFAIAFTLRNSTRRRIIRIKKGMRTNSLHGLNETPDLKAKIATDIYASGARGLVKILRDDHRWITAG